MVLLGQWGGTGPAPPVNSPPEEKTYQPTTGCEMVPATLQVQGGLLGMRYPVRTVD
jgi:hypothetical protein